jgi:hypothetical protein
MSELLYQPLEKISVAKPVNRIDYMAGACTGKKVLDLGCWDETALVKRDTPFWLHSRIAAVASNTIGIDSSLSLPIEGFSLPKAKIMRGDITDRKTIIGFDIDIIVAGELIEHLPNTLEFFHTLKSAYSGKRLLCSTPNATNFSNLALGLLCRESTHRDHLSVYSYKTLSILSEKSNFSEYSLIPYHVGYPEMLLRLKGMNRLFVRFAEKTVNIIEQLFPMYSGGYILDVIL